LQFAVRGRSKPTNAVNRRLVMLTHSANGVSGWTKKQGAPDR